MVPFLIGFYLFRVDIVTLLYGHGELSEAGQSHIASLLGIYLLGMLPRLISRLLIRAHLARQAHRTVVTATLIRLIPKSLSQLVFHAILGVRGNRLVNSIVCPTQFLHILRLCFGGEDNDI